MSCETGRAMKPRPDPVRQWRKHGPRPGRPTLWKTLTVREVRRTHLPARSAERRGGARRSGEGSRATGAADVVWLSPPRLLVEEARVVRPDGIQRPVCRAHSSRPLHAVWDGAASFGVPRAFLPARLLKLGAFALRSVWRRPRLSTILPFRGVCCRVWLAEGDDDLHGCARGVAGARTRTDPPHHLLALPASWRCARAILAPRRAPRAPPPPRRQ